METNGVRVDIDIKEVLKSKTVKSEIFLPVKELVLIDEYKHQASDFGLHHFFVYVH